MNQPTSHFERRNRSIATLLWYGTWIASGIIAVGMGLEILQQLGYLLLPGLSKNNIVKIGVALFILLPIARVALMLVIFLRERDYAYVVISAVVLAIIGTGILIGI